MQNQDFTLAFFNKRIERVLLLPSYDPYKSIHIALAEYGLQDVSFINVFKDGKFLHRRYIRAGNIAPQLGMVYDLKQDPYLRKQLVSNTPRFGVDRLREMASRGWNMFPDSIDL